MKNIFYKVHKADKAFSLAEVLAALTIGAMILVAVLGIYSRAERSAAAITRRFDSSRLASEVLQRIAEDLDRIITPGSDTKVTIKNKFEKGFSTARMAILKTIYDSKDSQETFEEIIWQSSYDYDSDADGLVLYRSHSGIGLEDRLLDESKENWERELFVPICAGVTFFRVQVPKGEDFQDQWNSSLLPQGIVVSISFAEPFKTLTGTLDVPDEDKITRTIAVDRTRKIRFAFIAKKTSKGTIIQDSNEAVLDEVDDIEDTNEADVSKEGSEER